MAATIAVKKADDGGGDLSEGGGVGSGDERSIQPISIWLSDQFA